MMTMGALAERAAAPLLPRPRLGFAGLGWMGRRRLEAIRAHVREHDVTGWIDAQLSDLDRCAARVGSS